MASKGFTMIELLAVIVLFSLLAVVITPVVSIGLKKASSKVQDTSKANFELAARDWGSNNKDKLPGINDSIFVRVLDLKEQGYIDGSGITNLDDIDNSCVKITNVSRDEGMVNYIYEFTLCD